jgi:S1-C subfamily serine protease
MGLISDYIFKIITDLNDNGKLSFRATKNESEDVPRFKVSLGVMPDYLFDGEGMKIDGVSKDRPAEKAGILKGDIVIKLGDYNVPDMMSYMRALSKFQSGESTSILIQREGKTIKKEITF